MLNFLKADFNRIIPKLTKIPEKLIAYESNFY